MKLVYTIGVLVSTLGCSVQTGTFPDQRPFVAVTFAYGSAAYKAPVSGCEEGCGCNGTGKETSGDGLAVVSCRCPESCECKAAAAPAPPLVPIPQPSIECVNGQCWLVEPDGRRYRIVK